ncbi:MAG: right-handed parallel beta-helix repeat-containing protein [Planctomycetes bacterium]|nr:right-handed parallel beta-helix repeat-containing protein [Planctomycetota bacterium]
MICLSSQRVLPFLVLASTLLAAVEDAAARTFYVNNRLGSDRFNGVAAEAVNRQTGPVATIGRALKLARSSDIISLADTGIPYYESISLVGVRHSGTAARPFTILGNGASLSGAIRVPETAWQQVGTDLWQLKPYRKGHYQLILDGKAVPEVRPQPDEKWTEVPELPVGSWCAFRGAIHYQAERLIEPESMNFAFAQRTTGITFYGVRNVFVDNLKVEHFRIDGANANDRATDVVLSGVLIVENGRAGLTVAGTSLVAVVGCRIERNRDESILLKEAAALVAQETRLDVPPTQK